MYQILSVSRHADAAAIKRSYRELARQLHPDTSQHPEAKTHFQILNDAYQILNDPLRRRLYNFQYDRHQAWLKQREEALAALKVYQAKQAEYEAALKTAKRKKKAAFTAPPPPPPPPPPPADIYRAQRPRDPKTTARQRTSSAEPYVSMAQMRQKHFYRYIPTIRTISIIIWLFVAFQMLDRVSTHVMEIEKVQAAEIKGGQWSGVFQRVETSAREFREDIYGHVDLEPGDLLQFEETWLMHRETEFMLIYTAHERKQKKMGQLYSNRIYYPYYVINFILLISAFAGFFLPHSFAELRFKFGLACIFFTILSIVVNLVF
ncbi:MAG: J domain-containing protein [Bacteroidia bacterium]